MYNVQDSIHFFFCLTVTHYYIGFIFVCLHGFYLNQPKYGSIYHQWICTVCKKIMLMFAGTLVVFGIVKVRFSHSDI